MTENIVTGKKYRILTDATQDIWDRISFWTKASDVYYDDNSNAEANRPIGILKRGTAYVVGTVAYEITAPSWVMLKCTTAGTTAASTPSTYKTISSSGTVITDGTAKFTVYDIRPTTTLSTNAYSVPTVSLLNTQISNLANRYSVAGYTQGVNLAVCDGISNWNAYLNTARNSYASWIANIDSKQLVHLDRLRLGSITIPNLSSMLFAKGQGIGTGGGAIFSYPYINGGKICMFEAIALAHYYEYNGSTFIDHGSEVPASGTVIAIDVTYYQKDM